MQHRARIHTELDALLAVIGERRAAAARGDAVATVWIAGLNHWLRQYRAGAVDADLIITPDLIPELRYHGAVADFEAGYRTAGAVQTAGSNP